jgi:hypothetical protein
MMNKHQTEPVQIAENACELRCSKKKGFGNAEAFEVANSEGLLIAEPW